MKQSIKEIKLELETVDTLSDKRLSQYEQDERKGVQKLVEQTRNRIDKQMKQQEAYERMWDYEKECYEKGHSYVVGIDEVGRGPLAGPVVAAAVILPRDFKGMGITDSKKLSSQKRDAFFDTIQEQAIAIGIGIIDEQTVDEVNVYETSKLAMIQAVENLNHEYDSLLIDAMRLPIKVPQESIIKGDAKSISIASASIIAKVTRDRMMEQYDEQYPGYGFKNNAGYGTKEHLERIHTHGITPIHRKTFEPIKSLLS